MTDRLLTAQELADRWQVPVSWIRSSTRSGFIPHRQLGRYVRYVAEECDEWLEKQKAGGAPWRKYEPRRVA